MLYSNFPSDKTIGVHCPLAYESELSVTLDGQQSCDFNYEATFNIRKSKTKAQLVRIAPVRFGQILREKLTWGRSYR